MMGEKVHREYLESNRTRLIMESQVVICDTLQVLIKSGMGIRESKEVLSECQYNEVFDPLLRDLEGMSASLKHVLEKEYGH